MFNDSGDMRTGKAKAQLKEQLQVEMSSGKVKCKVLDGSAVLRVIHCPANGTVRYFVVNFKQYIQHKLTSSDVSDWYQDFGTKTTTRCVRTTEASEYIDWL